MFQTSVASALGFGIPGEWYLDGPQRAQPGIIDSASGNRIGYAYTQVAGVDGHCIVGGAIAEGAPFMGILCDPKVYVNDLSSLAADFSLAQYTEAEFATMGEIIVSLGGGAFQIGDLVDYVVATGALVARAATAVGTGSISTTTLTISATAVAGFGVGSLVTGPNIAPGTYITALGSGSGGNGTYTVNVSQTAASGAVSAPTAAASGNAAVPRCAITRFNNSASGANLAVIKLTN